MRRVLWLPFLALLGVPTQASAQDVPIAIDIPAQFSINFPASSPSSCWRVAQPPDGRLTATVSGQGRWDVCVADVACPLDCMDNGLRTVTTERLRDGRFYFVKVVTHTPGVTATLDVYATATGPRGPVGGGGGGAAGGGAGIVGTWTYRSGGFTDVHVYHADGTVTAPNAPTSHATWRMEGNVVVSTWHNQWQNRVTLSGSTTLSGVAISPSGERQNITLTRSGGAATPTPAAGSTSSIVGRWEYGAGTFTDVHVYHADGTVSAPNARAVTATWQIEGNEVVSRWNNQWVNRIRLPIANGRTTGVAIGPTGARVDFTLRRLE